MVENEVFLKKALSLLPKIHAIEVEATGTVEILKNDKGAVCIKAADPYQKRTLQKGDRICLDFGNHQVGYLSLKLASVGSHADAPVWMRIRFAENPIELLEDAKKYRGWISASWIEEEQVHVDVIPSWLKLERRYAFRYVEIEILDISTKFSLRIEQAVCHAVSSADDDRLLPYDTDRELDRTLDRIACRTLHNCMQTVFEDGPKRDRRLWMGDLRMQALANYETYQNNDLVKACLYLFAALPLENGQIGACLFMEPEPEVDDTVLFDYSLFYINTLLDYYRNTEDIETLRELWPTALSQIYIAESRLGADGIIEDSDVMGWCFVDWNLELNKQASAQGIFLYSLRAAIGIAEILEEETEKKQLTELYRACKEAANQHLWDDEAEMYISGEKKQISCASQVWMVLGGCIEGEEAKRLLERIERDEQASGMVTPYMYHNYIDALMSVGETQKAVEKLETYWGGMAAQGADTFWELYNPQDPNESPYGGTIVNSYCHAWSCAPAYFLRKYKVGRNKA